MKNLLKSLLYLQIIDANLTFEPISLQIFPQILRVHS